MLIALDLEGVEVSMGSACAAGAVEPSHVLLAMGRSRGEARSSLRISLGWSTTAEEIDARGGDHHARMAAGPRGRIAGSGRQSGPAR